MWLEIFFSPKTIVVSLVSIQLESNYVTHLPQFVQVVRLLNLRRELVPMSRGRGQTGA